MQQKTRLQALAAYRNPFDVPRRFTLFVVCTRSIVAGSLVFARSRRILAPLGFGCCQKTVRRMTVLDLF